ncbi:LLM class flavin-dependent oxidoreductase [Gordonia sp. CPCC 206044]|uniref:LLM class flavin-dependent oxidoreductase n=1 Tax=Gordonia sp. CPCC 206044 TaxID=3140793 RepID=UPI003AF3C20E
MFISVFVRPMSSTTVTEGLDLANSLEAAGAASVCFLDPHDGEDRFLTFESTTMAGAVAARTDTIGVVAENSSLFGFPYHSARRLATIDHMSRGRSGWLMRTAPSSSESGAYEWRSAAGRGEELHRSTEYAEIALELWNSWEDGAQQPDKQSGAFKDDSRIRPIDYRSTSFRVAGPLDVPPSPQGRPVLFAEVSSKDEAVYLSRYVDVAIVIAEDDAAVTELALHVSGEDSTTEIVVAAHLSPDRRTLCAEDAASLVGQHAFGGVALYMSPTEAAAAVEMIGATGTIAPGATLAATLGIAEKFVHGGNAA